MDTFELTIHLFATLKDLAGSDAVQIDVPQNATIDDVRHVMAATYPKLAPALPSAIAAVNHTYVFSGHPVSPTDEVAFFPPVSGGSDDDDPAWPEIKLLAHEPIDLNTLTAEIVKPTTGAVALFSGYVRGMTQSKDGPLQTQYLEYEAYEPMALRKMQQVIDEIRSQWPHVQGIAIVQRIGHLEVGDPTVLIACAAGHRDEGCFDAARYGIDRLKEIVPVWKKEVGPTGQSWVEGHYVPSQDDETHRPI